MNFRKLLTYLTVSTAAVIPFAGAQNPTILQGSYISNVFGNSNFVLNPNAQTNIANVTTVTATVTRSTTTPLVATSEFTVAIGTANGTATWATRAFDAGMKNNNCEARFSYRGFAATSKVHIKQGANTVASLNLTPATDPRIASINFPCGDLSAATTFVVTDTAILAGTNEIGGIYVGLATNMANVAQAEVLVRATVGTSQSIPNNAYTKVAFDTETLDVYNEFNTSTNTFTAKRAGQYFITATYMFSSSAWAPNANILATIVKNGSETIQNWYPVQGSYTNFTGVTVNQTIDLAVGDTIWIGANQNSGGAKTIFASTTYSGMSISRFPSSSELVVTPERQNTWAGVVYTAENQSLFAGTAEPTGYAPFNAATWNQPTKLKGKATVTTTNSGNDLGFSVANLPVGNYKLDVTGLLNASTGGAAASTRVVCSFRLIETTTTTEISSQTHQDTQISIDGTRDYINAFTGVFNNTSVATRNFRIEAQKHDDNTTGNVGYCQAYSLTSASSNNSKIAIIMSPLDQPSNSALYVQGPVLSGQTGAVLPAGYIGEIITSASATSGSFLTGVTTKNVATITLQPGTWLLSANLRFEPISTFNNNILSISSSTSHDEQNAIQPQAALAGSYNSVANLTRVVRITSPNTIYYLNTSTWLPSGTGNYSQLVFTATRIGSN